MTNCPSCGNSYDTLGNHLAYSECSPKPSQYKQNILRGILMGDGWIGTTGRCIQSEWANRKYAKYVSNELGWICGDVSRRKKRDDIYQISTVSCDYIEDTYSEWYNNGKKVWDISKKLPNTTFQHLYACDGSLRVRQGRSPAAVITINNESHRAEKIASWIAESGFPKPSIHRSASATNLYFSTEDTPKLLNMIETVPGYEYKWM